MTIRPFVRRVLLAGLVAIVSTTGQAGAVAEEVSGRVIESRGGKPIAGAAVCPIDPASGKADVTAPVMVDAKGQLKISALRKGPLSVIVFASGFSPRRATVERNKDGSWPELVASLERGGAILEGRITDDAGMPIEGAVVEVDGPLYRARSDKEGRYRLERVRSVLWYGDFKGKPRTNAFVSIKHREFIVENEYPIDLDLAAERTTKDFALHRGRVLEGTVTAKEGGQALSGIKVTVGLDRRSSNVAIAQGVSDVDGHYRVTGAPLGAQFVHAESTDWAPTIATVTLGSEAPATHNFLLERGDDVSGRVLNEVGQPVEKAWLVTTEWEGLRVFQREAYTDKDGRFRLQHMPTTPTKIDIVKREFTSMRGLSVVGGQKDLEFKMYGAVQVRGKVLDAKTRQPIPRFWYAQAYPNPRESNLEWYERTFDRPNVEGAFEINESEVRQGRMLLEFRAEGYRSGPTPPIALRLGTKRENIEILLEPVQPVTGLVKDSTGALVVGGTIRFFSISEGTSNSETLDPLRESDPKRTVTIDQEGRFTWLGDISKMGLFAFKLGVGGTVINDLSMHGEGKSIEIVLRPFAAIEGYAYDGPSPIEGRTVKVMIDPQSRESLPPSLRNSTDRVVKTEKDGSFRFEHLLGEKTYGCALLVPKLPGSISDDYARYMTFFVSSGEHVACIFGGDPGASIHGKVVPPAGESLEGIAVALSDSRGQRIATLTRGDGSFELNSIPTGRHRISFEHRTFTGSSNFYWSQALNIPSHDTIKRTFTIVKGERVAVGSILSPLDIVDRNGSPFVFGKAPTEHAVLWLCNVHHSPSLEPTKWLKETMPTLAAKNVLLVPMFVNNASDPEEIDEVLAPLGLVGKEFTGTSRWSRSFFRKHFFHVQDANPVYLIDRNRKVVAICKNKEELEKALKEIQP